MNLQINENEKLEERTMEIYMNWKEAQEIKQKLEKEDSEWQETCKDFFLIPCVNDHNL